MADCLVDKTAGTVQETSSSKSWSVGVIAPTSPQLPPVCLEHCLSNDPALASTRGCPMVTGLIQRAQAAAEASLADGSSSLPPAVCNQGYEVSLLEGDGVGNPDVMILRPPALSPDADEALAPALEAVRSAAIEAWRLNHENNGLADEVLRNYEQMNLIFDVSAQIATLNDADEVCRMLLTKLREMFNADVVFLIFADRLTAIRVDHNGHVLRGWVPDNIRLRPESSESIKVGSWDLPRASTIELPPEFEQARDRLAESQKVFVATKGSGCEQTGHGTSMWGALADAEKSFSIVGILRRHTPFTSGDMLVLDSTLTYGGHILRNLQLVEQLKQTGFEVVRTLVNAIDQKDNYTSGHSERVGFLARATGQHMGLPGKQLTELEWAALLHDVGKIGIPEHVLNKPGRLTPEEYAVIKGHPSRGYEILDPVGSLEPVLEGVLHHHENPDGTGYPGGLKGDRIPLLASIIHVVDVFDALTSTRSYRKAYEPQRALSIIKDDAGTKLDAQIVENFLRAWAQLPMTHPEEYEQWFGSRKEAVS